MNGNLIHALNEKLLNASTQRGQELLFSMVNAIQETTNCRMCSLWSINTNNTNGEEFQSASLIFRKLENGVEYPTNDDVDFVHELDDCFIKYVLTKTEQIKQSYYCCPIEECNKHKSIESLKKLNLKYFISIPIPNQKNKIIAFLKLSFVDVSCITQLELFATTIRDLISSCFYRYMLYKQQRLINDLTENYKGKGWKNIKEIFYPVINTTFKTYFDYEGASVFLWNSYDNRYNLLTTTGIVNIENTPVYYDVGEGLTGKAAKGEKKPKIYDDLIALEKSPDSDYKHKYREKNDGKTMVLVPILRPSNPDNVIGIIRFVNKINEESKKNEKKVVDYFNDADIELIEYASHYLALIIDYFLGEEERNNFISKLSHESKTPANAIRVSADRIMKKMEDEMFMETQFKHYIQSIIDYADFQITQANSNLYISQFNRNTPKVELYDVQRLLITDIIKDSINIIRPYARDRKGIRFENIHIQENFPYWYLYIDKDAFKTIFYNLLTNTIKYVRTATEFRVVISGTVTPRHLIINVSDWGLGVKEEDKENIFLLGVRSEDAKKRNNEGYGIGLHIVQEILKDFEGEIRVSNCRFPTTFEIKLPRELFNNNYIYSKEWTE